MRILAELVLGDHCQEMADRTGRDDEQQEGPEDLGRAVESLEEDSDLESCVSGRFGFRESRHSLYFSIIAYEPFHSSGGGSFMNSLQRSASLREAASLLPSATKTSRKRIPAAEKLRAR